MQRLQTAERRLAEMKILRQLVKDLLDVSPEKAADQRVILDGAKGLLEKCAARQTRPIAMPFCDLLKTSAASAIGGRMMKSWHWTHGIG